MLATHRVYDNRGKAIGFLIDNNIFRTDYSIKVDIDLIDNVTLTQTGVVSEILPEITYKEIRLRQYNKLLEENPFVRDIQNDLLNWKNNPLHKVLQLEGARQIGKTTELLKFANQHYEYVIYVNLANDNFKFAESIKSTQVDAITIERHCRNVGLPSFVNNKNTLLIIDEIQMDHEVYNAIRTIEYGLECDIIVTGSYLAQTLSEEFFLPMGTIDLLTMYPLSFKEYCRIEHADTLLESIDIFGNSSDSEYQILQNLYEEYKIVGGYPEVVKVFIHSNKDKTAYKDKQRNLLNIFEKESRNYFKASKEPLIFKSVYNQVLNEMISEKRGNGASIVERVTKLYKESEKTLVTRDEISNAIQWLIYCGILGVCDLCNNGDVTTILPARRLYFIDCGILSFVASTVILEESAIEGLRSETFVYSELRRLHSVFDESKRKVKLDNPCFSTYNQYELDFLLVDKKNTIYGLEVKTNKGDYKSLKVYVDKGLVNRGIVAKNTQGGKNNVFETIPIYTVGERFPYQ